jgi:heterodisulfide reductase subunit A-like polyferredoxin
MKVLLTGAFGNIGESTLIALLERNHTVTCFDIDSIYAEIDNELCNKCELCVDLCPYSAPKLDEDSMVIMKELCQGCGTCAGGCPQEAIDMRHYRRSQIIPMIHTAVQKTLDK